MVGTMKNAITPKALSALLLILRCVSPDRKLTLKASLKDGRVIFSGGKFGEASIDASVSSRARIVAHFDGYCAANGIRWMPREGDRVTFRSASASAQMGGCRDGRVLKVFETRATIAFTYNHGGKAETTRSFTDLVPSWINDSAIYG